MLNRYRLSVPTKSAAATWAASNSRFGLVLSTMKYLLRTEVHTFAFRLPPTPSCHSSLSCFFEKLPSLASCSCLRFSRLHSAGRVLRSITLISSLATPDIFSGTVLKIQRTTAGENAIAFTQVSFRVDQAIRGVRAGESLTIREWSGLWDSG